MKLDKETQEKISELQLSEQNLQSFLMQKQNFQTQLVEVESAITEIEKSKESFKIIGNIMVKAEKKDLKKELEEKRDLLGLRIKNIEKQEGKIKEKASKLQEEVMKEMKGKK